MRYVLLILLLLVIAPGLAWSACCTTGQTHYFTVTVATGKVPSAQASYTYYFDLANAPAGFWSHVTSDGRDIRVYKQSGCTEMARDLVSIDTVGHTGELWFGTDTAQDGVIYEVCYGNSSLTAPAPTDANGRNNAWRAEANLVWHLEETTGAYVGSTGENDSVSLNGSPTRGVTGRIGKALSCDGVDDWISAGDPADGSLDMSTVDICYMAWVKIPNIASGTPVWLTKGTATNVAGYRSFYSATPDKFQHTYSDGTTTFTASAATTGTDDDTWRLIGGSYVRTGNLIPRMNSGSDGTGVAINATSANNSTPFTICAINNGTSPIAGTFDEIRFYRNFNCPTNWWATNYNNMNDPATFWSVGSEQSLSTESQGVIWIQ